MDSDPAIGNSVFLNGPFSAASLGCTLAIWVLIFLAGGPASAKTVF